MDDERDLPRAVIEAQREQTAERRALADSMLAEARSGLAEDTSTVLALRLVECVATERALLDALDRNAAMMLRAIDDTTP